MTPRRAKLLLAVIFSACALLIADYLRFSTQPLTLPSTGVVHTIAPGDSLYRSARALEAKGVLGSPLYLVALARLSGRAHRIQSGEYRLESGLTPLQLLDQLAEGRVVQYAITVIEGWHLSELLATLAQDKVLVRTLKSQDEATVLKAIDATERAAEGLFLPDTYHFPRGTRDVDFLRRAYRAMQTRLQTAWQERAPALPYQSPYEALIMASLIEKETANKDEMPRIAGVFVRRLQQGMKLQTDPTVIYGLGARYDGNLHKDDLLADTPYNTYTREGLPPTPIALPGARALAAALHPATDDSLYFVARGDGTHEFSATLEEHNRAVQQYQLKRSDTAIQKNGDNR
jgi:UPF0755 protein